MQRLCKHCGVADLSGFHWKRLYCIDCDSSVRNRDSGAALARNLVNRAVQRGELRPATDFLCSDCGDQAEHYDHRDYGKPLVVEPVCGICNLRRGPAIPAKREAEAA